MTLLFLTRFYVLVIIAAYIYGGIDGFIMTVLIMAVLAPLR